MSQKMSRVVVIATAACSGKTVFSDRLSRLLDSPHVELDALYWGPGWRGQSSAEFTALVQPIVSSDSWIIDGSYHGKLGDLVLRQADLVVWLDFPRRTWLPRLLRRTLVRLITRQELWNGNRESVRKALIGRRSLLVYSWRQAKLRRQWYPSLLAPFPHVRLHSDTEAECFLAGVAQRLAHGRPSSAIAQSFPERP